MIVISDKNAINTVYFPQNIYTENDGTYTLEILDRATNRRYTYEQIEDRRLVPYGFYTFLLEFVKIPEGEYEYTIADSNGETVGKGLIRLNELVDENIYYNNERTYVAYDRQ